MVAVWAHGTSVVPFPTHLVEGWRWALTKRNFLSAIILGAIVNIACVASITGAQIMLAARGANAVMIGLLGTAMGLSTLVGWLLQQPDLGFTAMMAVAVVCSVAGLAVSLAGPLRSIPNPDQWSEVFL